MEYQLKITSTIRVPTSPVLGPLIMSVTWPLVMSVTWVLIMSVTWALGLDNGLRGDTDTPVVEGQLAAGQTLRPAVVVNLHDGLAARLGPLTHRLAGLDGLVLEVDGADGSVHGTQEEQQVRTAACTCTQHGRPVHLGQSVGLFI